MSTMEQLIDIIKKVPYKDVEVVSTAGPFSATTATYLFKGVKFHYNSVDTCHFFLDDVQIDNINGDKILKILDEKIRCKNYNLKEDTIKSAVNKLKKALKL